MLNANAGCHDEERHQWYVCHHRDEDGATDNGATNNIWDMIFGRDGRIILTKWFSWQR